MPKAKTRKAAAKRFRVTGSGKIKRGQSGKKHLLEWKSSKQKRRLTSSVVVARADVANIRKVLPGI